MLKISPQGLYAWDIASIESPKTKWKRSRDEAASRRHGHVNAALTSSGFTQVNQSARLPDFDGVPESQEARRVPIGGLAPNIQLITSGPQTRR